MVQVLSEISRRTTADDIFDHLYGQINSMELLPGTRISEVEVAKQFDVSRQPVREAFIRLTNRGLLLVRPQKATIVRRFSYEKIMRARFIRIAVECEVLRHACRNLQENHEVILQNCIAAQEQAFQSQDIDKFHSLDYEFHKTLCEIAGAEFVFETIADNKAQVDRLCMLSLAQPTAMEVLLQDHRRIVDAIVKKDETKVVREITSHLSRLDEVVTEIRGSHGDYFEN